MQAQRDGFLVSALNLGYGPKFPERLLHYPRRYKLKSGPRSVHYEPRPPSPSSLLSRPVNLAPKHNFRLLERSSVRSARIDHPDSFSGRGRQTLPEISSRPDTHHRGSRQYNAADAQPIDSDIVDAVSEIKR